MIKTCAITGKAIDAIKSTSAETTMSDYFKEIGKKGGDARAAKLSKARRSEIARKAGKAKGKKAAAVLSTIVLAVVMAMAAICPWHPASTTYPTGGHTVVRGQYLSEYHCNAGNHNFWAP